MVFRNGRIPYKLLKQYSNVNKYQNALKLSIREFSTRNGNNDNNGNNIQSYSEEERFRQKETEEKRLEAELEKQRQGKSRMDSTLIEDENTIFYKKQYDARYTNNSSFQEEIQSINDAINSKILAEEEKFRKDIFLQSEEDFKFYEHQLNQLNAINDETQEESTEDYTEEAKEDGEENGEEEKEEEEEDDNELKKKDIPSRTKEGIVQGVNTPPVFVPGIGYAEDPLDEKLNMPVDTGKFNALMDVKTSDLYYKFRKSSPKTEIDRDELDKARMISSYIGDDPYIWEKEDHNKNKYQKNKDVYKLNNNEADLGQELDLQEADEPENEENYNEEDDLNNITDAEVREVILEAKAMEGYKEAFEEEEVNLIQLDKDLSEGSTITDPLEIFNTVTCLTASASLDDTMNTEDIELEEWAAENLDEDENAMSEEKDSDASSTGHVTNSEGFSQTLPDESTHSERYELPDVALLRDADPMEESMDTFDQKARVKYEEFGNKDLTYSKKKPSQEKLKTKGDYELIKDLGYEGSFKEYLKLNGSEKQKLFEEFDIDEDDYNDIIVLADGEKNVYQTNINGIPVPFIASNYNEKQIAKFEQLAKDLGLSLDDFKEPETSNENVTEDSHESGLEALENAEENVDNEENIEDEESVEEQKINLEDLNEEELALLEEKRALLKEDLLKASIESSRIRKENYLLFKKVLSAMYKLNKEEEKAVKSYYNKLSAQNNTKDQFAAKLEKYLQDNLQLLETQKIHENYMATMKPKEKKVFKLQDLYDYYNGEAYAHDPRTSATPSTIVNLYQLNNRGVNKISKSLVDQVDSNGLPISKIDPTDIWDQPHTKEEVEEYQNLKNNPVTSLGVQDRYEQMVEENQKQRKLDIEYQSKRQTFDDVPELNGKLTPQEEYNLVNMAINDLPGTIQGAPTQLPQFVNHSKNRPAYYDNHTETLMHWEEGDYRKVFEGDDKISHLIGNLFMDSIFTKEEQGQLQNIFSSQNNLKRFIQASKANQKSSSLQQLKSLLKDIDTENAEKAQNIEDPEKVKLFKEVQAYLNRDLENFTQEQINIAANEQLKRTDITQFSNLDQPQVDLVAEFATNKEGQPITDLEDYHRFDDSNTIPEDQIHISVEGKKSKEKVNPFGDESELPISDEEFALLEEQYGDIYPVGPGVNNKYELYYEGLNNKTEAQKQRTFEQISELEKNKYFLVDLEREIARLENLDENDIPISLKDKSIPKPTEEDVEDDLNELKKDIKEHSLINEELSKFLNVNSLLDTGLLSDPIPKDVHFHGREQYSRDQLKYYFYEYKQRQKALENKLESPYQEDIKKKEKSDINTLQKQQFNIKSIKPQDIQYTTQVPVSFEPEELKEYMDFKASAMPERYLRMNENIENMKDDIDDLHYDREDQIRNKEIFDYLKADLEKSMISRLEGEKEFEYEMVLKNLDRDGEYTGPIDSSVLDTNNSNNPNEVINVNDAEINVEGIEDVFGDDATNVENDEYTITEDINENEIQQDLKENEEDSGEPVDIFDDNDLLTELDESIDESGISSGEEGILKAKDSKKQDVSEQEEDVSEQDESVSELEAQNDEYTELEAKENDKDYVSEQEEDIGEIVQEGEEKEVDQAEEMKAIIEYHNQISSKTIVNEIIAQNNLLKPKTEIDLPSIQMNKSAPLLFKPYSQEISSTYELQNRQIDSDENQLSMKDLETPLPRSYDELRNIFFSRYIINFPKIQGLADIVDVEEEIYEYDLANPHLPLEEFDPETLASDKYEVQQKIREEMVEKLENEIDRALRNPIDISERVNLLEPLYHDSYKGQIDGRYVFDYAILLSEDFLGIDKDGRIVMKLKGFEPIFKPLSELKSNIENEEELEGDEANDFDDDEVVLENNIEDVQETPTHSHLKVIEYRNSEPVYGFDNNGRPIFGMDEAGNQLTGFDEKGLPIYNNSSKNTTVETGSNFNWPYEAYLGEGKENFNPFTARPLTKEQKQEIKDLNLLSGGDKEFLRDVEEVTDSMFTDNGDLDLDLEGEDFVDFEKELDSAEVEALLGKSVPLQVDQQLMDKFTEENFDKMKQMTGDQLVKFMDEQYNIYSEQDNQAEATTTTEASTAVTEYKHKYDEDSIDIDEEVNPKLLKDLFNPLLDDPQNQIEGLDFYFDNDGQLVITSPKGLEQVQSYYEELELLDVVQGTIEDDLDILRSEADMYIKRNEKKLKQLLARRNKAAEHRKLQLEKIKVNKTEQTPKEYSIPVLPQSGINGVYRNIISPPNSYLKLNKLPKDKKDQFSEILGESYRVLASNPFYSIRDTKQSVRQIRQEFTNANKHRITREKEMKNPPTYTTKKKVAKTMLVKPEDVPNYFPHYFRDIDVNAESNKLS